MMMIINNNFEDSNSSPVSLKINGDNDGFSAEIDDDLLMETDDDDD